MTETVAMDGRFAAEVPAAPPLVTRQLTVRLRKRQLGPFDVEVARGEAVALSGPNGSGKTTCIRLALGLDRALAGTSVIFGHRVDPLHPPRHVGFVPDRAEFWDWRTGLENVEPFSAPTVDPSAWLERLGLAAAARQPVRGYSRGMRQRLAVARALVSAPRLLVLDEPTIALDESGIAVLLAVIEEQRHLGTAVLVASHDRPFVERLGARVIRVCDGRTER